MESTRGHVCLNRKHPDSSQKMGDSVVRTDGQATDQPARPPNSPEMASKTKPSSSKRQSAKSRKPKKSSKPCISGGKTKHAGTRRPNHLGKPGDLSSSDSELCSSGDSDEISFTGSLSDAAFSSSDERNSRGKRGSRRLKRSRSVSVRRFRNVHDNNLHGTGDGTATPPHGGVGVRNDRGVEKCVNATSQQDIVHALAQLELRCSQLQHQLGSLGGYQVPQANRMFLLQQPQVLGMLASPSPIADMAPDEYPPGLSQMNHKGLKPSAPSLPVNSRVSKSPNLPAGLEPTVNSPESGKSASRRAVRNGPKLGYKRVDAIWDSRLYSYKLQSTARVSLESKYEGYLFHVRRTFDSDGRFRATFIDIKSQLLRECLQDVIGSIRGLNLVDECPKIDPNLLFLYLEDLRSHLKNLKRVEPAGKRKRERGRNQFRLDSKRKELKVLVKYLDKDYSSMKESLYPMLDSGIISFEYLWVLWKPDTLVYSATYGETEDPRVFKVDMAVRHTSLFEGTFYQIDGKYLEFDGKRFGLGNVSERIAEFHGVRKISSLPFYPLSYHKDEPRVREMLIERGKKFVSLSGAQLKEYSGIAYMKRKKEAIMKFHIQKSRIMVDPSIFRRINPNYAVSSVRPKDFDALSEPGSYDGEDDGLESWMNCDVSEEGGLKLVRTMTKDSDCSCLMAEAIQARLATKSNSPALQPLPTPSSTTVQGGVSTDSLREDKVCETRNEDGAVADQSLAFTDDDYLLASPVVLGFSFSEKQWLEFSVSRIREIKWNEDAWGSLVLPPETKDLIKALVKSRKYNLAQTIDDVIQGKGKGFVSVLHGPPGTGKTLTAEGISELLRCPLYMVSAGELGTNSQFLEAELQKILDICHCWGAILLLDEADVFLEKRNVQDIHRNALVSIFLRQLEYFQGILFLTTNRVETFDEAFQSRIHIALRYDGLDSKAKKAIFKMFIDRVEAHGKLVVEPFTDEDFNQLAKHDLNGREIKNMIGSAQDLALNKAEALSMRHMQQVLDIHAKFGRDLRGGAGYEDAMRSYC